MCESAAWRNLRRAAMSMSPISLIWGEPPFPARVWEDPAPPLVPRLLRAWRTPGLIEPSCERQHGGSCCDAGLRPARVATLPLLLLQQLMVCALAV